MTASGTLWTRPQILAAIHLYLQLPFGRLDQRNPKIVELAGWLGRSPGSVALKLVNLASLDPAIVASGRSGMGNVSALDRQVWGELEADWDAVVVAAATEYGHLAGRHGAVADADILAEEAPLAAGTTRFATVEVRVEQARFRRAVLASYGGTCCISGLRHERLLVASHIIPWREDAKNRLNPRNGLCLSALHDRAYDQGLITVLPDLTVRVAEDVRTGPTDLFMAQALLAFHGRPIARAERFAPAPEFLAAHARSFGFLP